MAPVTDLAWQDHAACRGLPWWWDDGHRAEQIRTCAACPVVVDCLTFAFAADAEAERREREAEASEARAELADALRDLKSMEFIAAEAAAALREAREYARGVRPRSRAERAAAADAREAIRPALDTARSEARDINAAVRRTRKLTERLERRIAKLERPVAVVKGGHNRADHGTWGGTGPRARRQGSAAWREGGDVWDQALAEHLAWLAAEGASTGRLTAHPWNRTGREQITHGLPGSYNHCTAGPEGKRCDLCKLGKGLHTDERRLQRREGEAAA